MSIVSLQEVAIGYHGTAIIDGINLSLPKGRLAAY